jgi:hypothetical protein
MGPNQLVRTETYSLHKITDQSPARNTFCGWCEYDLASTRSILFTLSLACQCAPLACNEPSHIRTGKTPPPQTLAIALIKLENKIGKISEPSQEPRLDFLAA